MNTLKSTLSLVIALLFFTSMINAAPSPTNWEKLGTKKVNFVLDHDVMNVGIIEGGFTKLKIEVTGGFLNMHKMLVTYGNGSTEEITLKNNFAPGGESRIIDLNGGKRVIKKITFWYDTKNASVKKVKLHVYGRH